MNLLAEHELDRVGLSLKTVGWWGASVARVKRVGFNDPLEEACSQYKAAAATHNTAKPLRMSAVRAMSSAVPGAELGDRFTTL